MVSFRAAFWAVLGVSASIGCSKSPEVVPPSPPSQPADTAPAAAPLAVEPIASASPPPAPAGERPALSAAELTPAAAPASSSKTDAHSAKPATTSAAHKAVPTVAKQAPSTGGAAKSSCGEKGQPACPLQSFMKGTVGPAAASGEGEPLAKALDQVAAHAPPGLSNWASIAKEGAKKARAGDLDGAKASCKSCHDQYKARYKADLRDRPF